MTEFFEGICTRKEERYGGSFYYYLDTPFGEFEVRGISPSDNVLTVFGAFMGDKETFAAAKEAGYDCNPYTGKWNHHLTRGSVEGCMERIKLSYAGLIRNDELMKEIING